MTLQYKNTFLEFVPSVPELKRSKTLPDLKFTFETEQKLSLDYVDSDADTEYRSSESTEEDSNDDSPKHASERRHLTGPLWADMTDEDEDEESFAPLVELAAAAPASAPSAAPAVAPAEAPKLSWADITDSDDEEASTEEPKPQAEDDGWTTVIAKKGKKSRR